MTYTDIELDEEGEQPNEVEEDILQYGSAEIEKEKPVIEENGEPHIEDCSSPSEDQDAIEEYKEMLRGKLDDGIFTPSLSRILSGGATIILSSEC